VAAPPLEEPHGSECEIHCEACLDIRLPMHPFCPIQDHGNLFWPDAPIMGEHFFLRAEAYALHKLLPPWLLSPKIRHHMAETGQIVFNRLGGTESLIALRAAAFPRV
jgi:hypothetical protein